MDPNELEALDPLHYSPVDVNGGVIGPPFPIVHNQLLCLAHIGGVVVVLLIIVGDQAYHCCVVSKLNDGVGVVLGHAVMGEQGLKEGTKACTHEVPRFEEQCGRCVVAYLYHLGAARQEVQDPVAEGGV